MLTPRHIGVAIGAMALVTSAIGSQGWSANAQSATSPRVVASSYGFQTISHPRDTTFTQLLGINSRQMIAGYYGSGQRVNGSLHPNRGFTLTLPRHFSAENFPGSVQTQVIAVNNRGDTAGFYIDRPGTTHGFLRIDGTFHTADRPRTGFNQILGLNNRGQAAGYYQDPQGYDHAYVRNSNGSFSTLPVADSQATGINDAGIVVGFTQPSDTTSAGFVFQGGTLSILIYPGSAFTQALGENNKGQIVGFYDDGAGASHGFLYNQRARTYQSIDVPGSSATTINGINDAGRIVGFSVDAHGNTVGFVGTPGTGQLQPTASPTSAQATPTVTPTAAPAGSRGRPSATPTPSPTGTLTTTTTIKLGLVLPLSGQDAALGLSAEHGAQLAIDQANGARLVPGVTFVLAAKDDAGAGGTPDGAMGAAGVLSLIADAQVAGIIGPFDTSTALQELPLANRAGLLAVSPSAGDPCLTSSDITSGCVTPPTELATVRPTGNVTFYRTVPTDAQQSGVLANYLYTTKNFRKAYVVDDTAAYGVTVANTFSQVWSALGGSIVGRASQQEGTASYVNLLTQIAAQRPDVIFYGGSDPASGTPGSVLIRQQLLQVPALKNTAFAGTDGIDTPQLAQVVGITGGPVFSTLTPADPAAIPSATTFVQQYQAAYGTPGRYSAGGYDSANVLLAAIKAAATRGAQLPTSAGGAGTAQTLRAAVLAATRATKLNGVLGTLSFTANGDLAQGAIDIQQIASVNGAAAWQHVSTLQVP